MAGRQASSSLTPDMAKLGTGPTSASCHPTTVGLRKLIHDCLDKQMFSTAVFYAEKLCRIPSSNVSDHVLFAKCFLQSGEQRRCLVTLEHKGLLGVDVIAPLSNALKLPEYPSHGPCAFLTPVHHSHLSAVYLAGTCLFQLDEHEDCLSFLEPFLSVEHDGSGVATANHILSVLPNQAYSVHLMSGIYSLAGRCFDILENRTRAIRALTIALRIDPACTEVAEYIVSRGLMSQQDRYDLLRGAIDLSRESGRDWLAPYYRSLLEDGDPEALEREMSSGTTGDPLEEEGGTGGWNGREGAKMAQAISPLSLVRRAEYLYNKHLHEEAYRMARQAYTIDPYDWRGNLIYIAAMVDLKLKNELFYLGHELANTHPKQAISWYTVGCYYWTCGKFEQAQKYLQKATKIDRRLAQAWILLGHVLAAQEESEHAISAYRTACRILPGDHRPQIFMAKELVRTSNYALALHVLTEARDRCPDDPSVLNELGAVYMHLDRSQDALNPLRAAAESILRVGGKDGKRKSATGAVEILSNYATCLRRCGMLENALEWYYQCLAYEPMDAETHANIGFTMHMCRRFDEAIEQYHRALSLQPSFSFCADMLTQVLEDMSLYKATPAPQRETAAKYLSEMFPSEQADEDVNCIEASTVPLDMKNSSFDDRSFVIHHDDDRYGSFSPVFGDGVSRIDETFNEVSVRQRGRESAGGISFESSSQFDSVESYSRIAGRLSLDSTMSNT